MPTDQDVYGRAYEDVVSIQSFLKEFSIPRDVFEQKVQERAEGGASAMEISEEEYREQFGYTAVQIDALYSGDQAQINAAFCGPLAFVNEADGELYSIYWLADHSAEDYVEAGLPMDKVEEILTLAQEEYAMDPSIAALTETVQDTLSRAIALEEELAAGGVSEAAE